MKIIAIEIRNRGLRIGFRKTYEDHTHSEHKHYCKNQDGFDLTLRDVLDVIESDNPTVYMDEDFKDMQEALRLKTANLISTTSAGFLDLDSLR